MRSRTGTQNQLSLDELGTPLRETTFVVVDTETTGTAPTSSGLTEIGAVRVRGGEVLGEFSTLINPGRPVPPQVTALTGITTAMVTDAPPIERALPAFLEFSGDAVLVAHNAAFDTRFLREACHAHDYRWPRPQVLCSLRLARRVLPRREVGDHKLGTLARALDLDHQPAHRALDDARATVDLLHALLERLGTQGVQSLEELLDYRSEVTSTVRRKRSLAADLPERPGVYLFRGPNEEVLYVGTATNLRSRVRQYFTGSEQRGRMREMLGLAQRVDSVECAHALEARIRELRLLAAHRPAYNRRSRNPDTSWWIVLTEEPYPRLSVVRTPRESALGPFRSRPRATAAAETLASAVGLRTCTQRIPARGAAGSPCVLAELGQCGAPCAGRESRRNYAQRVHVARELFSAESDLPLRLAAQRIDTLARGEHFEQAACRRDELAILVHDTERGHRLAALAALAELVAAAPDGAGGWELVVLRYGRLASAGVARRGTPPMPVVDALVASAETITPGRGPLRGAPTEETTALLDWLGSRGVRLVRVSEPWAEPAGSAALWRGWIEQVSSAAESEHGYDARK